jgi:nucleotide-binding universal stress UspA family protein
MAQAAVLPWQSLSQECPLADLTVIGQSAVRGEGPWTGLLGEALMEARAPVLIARQGCAADTGAAIVAWNGSLEAGRAVKAALPLLTLASRVIVAQSVEGEELEADRPDADRLAAHLRRSGVHEVSVWRRQSRHAAEDLITLSRELSVSLLVSGAYGHSRLRETFLGGVTQSLLRQEQGCDLLIAH